MSDELNKEHNSAFSVRWSRMEQQLDKLDSGQDAINQTLAGIGPVLAQFKETKDQVANHENRITTIEANEVGEFSKRIGKVENVTAHVKGWIAGAVAVGGLALIVLMWFLDKLVKELAN